MPLKRTAHQSESNRLVQAYSSNHVFDNAFKGRDWDIKYVHDGMKKMRRPFRTQIQAGKGSKYRVREVLVEEVTY